MPETLKEKANRAKTYLQRLEQCDARINAMQDKIDSLYEQATDITAKLKQDVVSGGGNRDKIGDTAVKIADLKRTLERQRNFYVALQQEADELLSKLTNNVHYTILYRRYMLGNEWSVIAAEIGKGERWTQSLHGDALLAFADILAEYGETTEGKGEKKE